MGDLKLEHSIENGSASMLNLLDHEEFRRQGHMMIDFPADYYQNIEIYPVRSQVEPGYLRRYAKGIIPGITHRQSPNFFAYFQSSGSIANFLD
ncbi:hypothetical protein RJ639_010543 [Escallonia herrerae]|uniref:Uncharacterized protein n=1 Tax=Escallonia herrerae TaxID=1293975 RepID=A0AA88VJI8_9ASTE|nr:hypothetical protein RJ639_010543 [Escallonia herrerae]